MVGNLWNLGIGPILFLRLLTVAELRRLRVPELERERRVLVQVDDEPLLEEVRRLLALQLRERDLLRAEDLEADRLHRLPPPGRALVRGRVVVVVEADRVDERGELPRVGRVEPGGAVPGCA